MGIGFSAEALCLISQCAPAPSTTLRVVPLPRFAGEDPRRPRCMPAWGWKERDASECGELDGERRADLEVLERLGERAGRMVDAEHGEPVGVLVDDDEVFAGR